MANIRIYIDNKLCDLPESNLNLNLTYALKDRNGIAVNTGSRSEYSFELPATKNNDTIFSRFYDVSEDTVAEQKFLPAYIEVDGLPFFSGLAQLTSVTIDQDFYYWKGQNYKVSFYGNNVDWVQQLKNKFLYQYDYGTHTHDYSQILTSVNYDYFNNYTYKYILIKWKDWLTSGQVDALEYTPALFIKSIVDRIFSDIGYTYNSNFMNLLSFEKLIMPIPLADRITDAQYGLDYLNISANYQWTPPINFLEYPFILPNQTFAPNLAPNPYNPATGIYTVPLDGFYELNIRAEFTNVTGTIYPSFIYGLNGQWTIPTFNYIAQPTITTDGILTYSIVLQLNAGDTLALGIGFGFASASFELDFYFDLIGESKISNGLIVDFKYFINKQWNSLDFIKGLAHAFNLTFQTDVDNKTITIEPANNYLNQSSYPSVSNSETGFYTNNFIDLTEDVDLIKGGEVYSKSDITELVKLSWQYDSNDPTLEAISGVEDIALHQARFTFIANRFQKDEEVLENPFFSTTLCIAESTIQGTNTTKTPIIPIIWNENYLENTISAEANYDIMPRILTTEEANGITNGLINVYDGSVVAEYPCPVAFMVDYNNTSGNFISLSFGSETVNGNYVQGLLERFYLGDFVRRQCGKEVECYIFWDALMVRQLDFSKLVKIHGDNYILQEVNSYSVTSTDSTKTYLIYDDQGDGTEATQITNSLIIGKLNV
jgi:hypothetical protein